MDLLLAGAQGLALALAAGVLFGAAALRGNPGLALALVAAVVGAFLYGISLTPEDHPAWPGWLVGAPAAILSYFTSRDVASVASARAGEGGTAGVAFFVALFALALAGLSLLGPVALIGFAALLATIYVFVSRRRKAAQKHAGLRTLR